MCMRALWLFKLCNWSVLLTCSNPNYVIGYTCQHIRRVFVYVLPCILLIHAHMWGYAYTCFCIFCFNSMRVVKNLIATASNQYLRLANTESPELTDKGMRDLIPFIFVSLVMIWDKKKVVYDRDASCVGLST